MTARERRFLRFPFLVGAILLFPLIIIMAWVLFDGLSLWRTMVFAWRTGVAVLLLKPLPELKDVMTPEEWRGTA